MSSSGLARASRVRALGGPTLGVPTLGVIAASLMGVGHVLAQAPTDASPAAALASWIDDYAALPELDRATVAEPYRPAFFADVQLRTEADRLDPGRQRYALRAQPLLPYVRKAERELQAAQRAALPAADEPARREAAAEALGIVFDLASAQRDISLLEAGIALNDSLVRLTRLRLAEPGFDVERVLDVEDDLSDLTAERDAGRALLARRPPPVSADGLVDAATALARAADLLALGVRPDGTLEAELALLDAAVAVERADNWKVVDFVQLDYRSDLEEQGERFSVGFGVNLPRARIQKLDELAVERVEEVHEARLDDREAARELALAYEEMLEAADGLYALQAAAAERRRRRANLADALRRSTQTRPDDLMKIRRRNLRDARDIAEAEAEVLAAYAELVGRSGRVDESGLARWVLR